MKRLLRVRTQSGPATHSSRRFSTVFAFGVSLAFLAGCQTAPRLGTIAPRTGDEIVVAGKFVHTGTPVVLWMDPGGYDAYRVERRFAPLTNSDWDTSHQQVAELKSPNRYGLRRKGLTREEIERVRGGGWDLPTLQKVVDQFVIHFDVAGTSRQCFNILQDHRDLSVQFMLDLDGTIYQTLDAKERAWQATKANDRSVGIEIANMGAYSPNGGKRLEDWYKREPNAETRITIPPYVKESGIRTKNWVGRPARPEPVRGIIQGEDLVQYDYTPEQYEALTKLTATLCKVLPRIKCDYPKNAEGKLITRKLPDDVYDDYQGVLGHYHVQANKTDPGPAFQWDRVIGGARRLINNGFTAEADATSAGHMRRR